MRHSQEDIARELHTEMRRRFKSDVTFIDIQGLGVHWHCTAERGSRECKVRCISGRNPEYLTSFRQTSEGLAWSRSLSRDATLAAISDWLDENSLETLYKNHPIIDSKKRQLENIRKSTLECEPCLTDSVESILFHHGCDNYTLKFRANDRLCKVYYCGKDELPVAEFEWDKCRLFKYQPSDNNILATIIKHWVCDAVMPSQMKSEFPWLVIDELADYYEAGNPIEGEFLMSWQSVDQFYDNPLFTSGKDVKALIATMRSKGFDRTLRAGTSLWTLIVSRSRRHGLQRGQPSIQFWFLEKGMDIYNFMEEKPSMDNEPVPQIQLPEIKYCNEIEDLLNQLQSKPIV